VGFQNEKSFMRAFKGWTGVTPDEFRTSRQG
jgi:AraC-like DNA-binding protein